MRFYRRNSFWWFLPAGGVFYYTIYTMFFVTKSVCITPPEYFGDGLSSDMIVIEGAYEHHFPTGHVIQLFVIAIILYLIPLIYFRKKARASRLFFREAKVSLGQKRKELDDAKVAYRGACDKARGVLKTARIISGPLH